MDGRKIRFYVSIYGKIIIQKNICTIFVVFSFEYVEPPDGAFGAFINGSWNGLIGMVVRGVSMKNILLQVNPFYCDVFHQEIAIVATALSVTYPRSLVVDYTYAFSDDPISLLIPFPQLDSTISGIIKPFQYEVFS